MKIIISMAIIFISLGWVIACCSKKLDFEPIKKKKEMFSKGRFRKTPSPPMRR